MKLINLLNEETFTATRKDTGRVSVFKSKDARDTAIKTGTHTAVKDKGQPSSTSQKAAGADMFGGDYAQSRGGQTSTPQKSVPAKIKLNPTKIRSDLKDLKGTKGMELAKAILAGDKDPQQSMGLKDNQYNSLLKRLAKIGGKSPHDDAFRTNNYSTNDLEKWAKERLDQTLAKVKPSKPQTPEDKARSLHRQIRNATNSIDWYANMLKKQETTDYWKQHYTEELEKAKKRIEVAKKKLNQYGGYDTNYDASSNSVKAIKNAVKSVSNFDDIFDAVKQAKDKTKQIKFGWNGGQLDNGVKYFMYPPMDQEYMIFDTSTPEGKAEAIKQAKDFGVKPEKLNNTLWGVDVADWRTKTK
jgi:hypothetical protein